LYETADDLWFAKTLADFEINDIATAVVRQTLADFEINDIAAALPPLFCYNS
jgi:hypothetical protein